MSENQIVLILLKNALTGSDTPLPFVPDWRKVIEICVKQQIYMLVFPAVKKLPEEQRPSAELFDYWNRLVLMQSAANSGKFSEFYSLMKKADENGVELALLKGSVTRNLYPVPEYRTMGDADILALSDIETCEKFFTDNGYVSTRKNTIEYDLKKHGALSIELFSTLSQDFEHFFENKAVVKAADENKYFAAVIPYSEYTHIKCFNVEWQIIYWCIHFGKHFFRNGAGIRNICDLYFLLKLPHDISVVKEQLQKYNLLKFFKVCMAICDKFFDDKTIDESIEALVEKTVEFLLSEGQYGDMSEHAGAKVNLREKGFFRYMFSLAFPPAKVMKKKYPSLNGKSILLPFYYVGHIFICLFRKKKALKNTVYVISGKDTVLKSFYREFLN